MNIWSFSYVFSILLFLRLQFWVRAAFVCSQHFEWENLEASLSELNISFKWFYLAGSGDTQLRSQYCLGWGLGIQCQPGIHRETLSRRKEGGRRIREMGGMRVPLALYLMKRLSYCPDCWYVHRPYCYLFPRTPFFFEATMMSLHTSYSYSHCVPGWTFLQQPITVKA